MRTCSGLDDHHAVTGNDQSVVGTRQALHIGHVQDHPRVLRLAGAQGYTLAQGQWGLTCVGKPQIDGCDLGPPGIAEHSALIIRNRTCPKPVLFGKTIRSVNWLE
jgi:hypothetical protein